MFSIEIHFSSLNFLVALCDDHILSITMTQGRIQDIRMGVP